MQEADWHRPPGDRNPEPDELALWEPFLRRELALVQPHRQS